MKKKLTAILKSRWFNRCAALAAVGMVTMGTAHADYTSQIQATATEISTQATALFAALVPVAGIIAVGAFVVRRIQRGI